MSVSRSTIDHSPFVQIKDVSKLFGEFVAVSKVSLDIQQGELFSILGASGCGKTTLLRMLAGFEVPTAGRIFIDGLDVTDLPPYQRPVNMMFQSYALFPHMTVAQNIAYGLKREKKPQEEVRTRVASMLKLVQMEELSSRKPDQLSGGQRQRVALARALARQPKLLLLDEPLAALDKKLREQTQFELANIQYELGITFVVVTHDQEEAMTLSSRIAVMDQGKLLQVGPPKEIYEYPHSRFVADFIGTINQFDGTVTVAENNEVQVQVAGQASALRALCDNPPKVGTLACIAVRPEKIFITRDRPDGEAVTVMEGTIVEQGYFGNLSLYQIKTAGDKIVQVSAQNRTRSAERPLDWDEQVFLSWNHGSALLLTQ